MTNSQIILFAIGVAIALLICTLISLADNSAYECNSCNEYILPETPETTFNNKLARV